MKLEERIAAAAVAAAKAGDGARRDALRLLVAALHNREIEKRTKEGDAPTGGALTEEESVEVLVREAKKRKEAIEFFEQGGRPAQAAKERAELAVIEEYLPAALSEADVERLVGEALRVSGASSVKDMGKVMAAFRALAEKAAPESRVDAGAVSAKIKAQLSAGA